MTIRIRKPEERTCERCGRHERWDDDAATWRVEDEGNVYCIHEWDINGTFLPFEDAGGENGAVEG